jgi:hypothetical protein
MRGVPVPAIPSARRRRSSLLPHALPTVWTALTLLAMVAADRSSGAPLAAVAAGVRRRFARLQDSRDRGLTTVEVAIITAVLLGLATALVVAITVVVNRNTAKIK